MHTHNVNSKTATTTPPERWGAKTVRHLIDEGHYSVFCAEQAYANYGDKFTRLDACSYFIRGAASALVEVICKSFR